MINTKLVMQNLEKHEELLKEARKQYPDMVLDGAVDNACWSKERIRVLWVLKEMKEFPKGNDLRNLLRQIANDPEPDKVYTNWKLAYKSLINASYELINNERRVDSLYDKRVILNHIAVVSINKDISPRMSSFSELSEAADKFREIILKQINLLDPTIVILADAFHYLYRKE